MATKKVRKSKSPVNPLSDQESVAFLDYLSIKQSATYFKCSQDTIRNRIADGSLPAYRFGGRLIRVKKTDLENLFRLIPSAVTK